MNWLSKIFSTTDPHASAKQPQQGSVEFTPTAANEVRTASAADNPIRKPAEDRIGRARTSPAVSGEDVSWVVMVQSPVGSVWSLLGKYLFHCQVEQVGDAEG